MSRTFPLSDVLTVTTGRLLTTDGMGAIYKILNYMTQDDLYTHQLLRGLKECEPWLLRQYPGLAEVDVAALDARLARIDPTDQQALQECCTTWVAEQAVRLGDALPIDPIPPDDHDQIDPLTELRSMVPPERIVVVPVPEDPTDG